MFQRLKFYKAISSLSWVLQLKLKRWLKEPLHDDIIEAKEVNIYLSFERYKRKLVLRFKARQYILIFLFF